MFHPTVPEATTSVEPSAVINELELELTTVYADVLDATAITP